VDGGKIRIRTPQGTLHLARIQGACDLEGYRGIFPRQRCPDRVVNHQPLASPITCLGDGHDGVWNIIDEIANGERREILDWYH